MTSFVTVDGRRLCFLTGGDPQGTPVFALHGTPGCRLNRHPDDHAVAATGVFLITYDRPGYGQSQRHPGRRVVDCATDVAAIANHLGIDRFAVTGGSGGGPHALAVAARLPDRVLRARCEVGVAPYPADGLDWFAGMDPGNVAEFGWALAGEEVLARELTREAAQMVERVSRDPSALLADFDLSVQDREKLDDPVMRRMVAEAIPETFAHGVWGWVDDDLAFTRPWGFDVSEIRVPVEVWYGETDVLVPPGHGRWLAAHVPGAQVRAFGEEGHLTTPDQRLADLADLAAAAAG